MTGAWRPLATFDGVIDVSHHNGTINWRAVPASIVLVMIKATEGAGFVDPRFVANRAGASRAGRLVVPYHFLTAESPDYQLQNLVRALGDNYIGPVMVDWEGEAGSRPPIAVMEAFGKLVERMIGRTPLAYHGLFDLSSPVINSWPWMIPKYGPQPMGPKWLFWQDRPNLHLVGVPSLVDHSVFAGTEAELRAWHSTGAMPKGF